MALPSLRMLWVYAKFLVPRAWQVLCENIRTRIHRLTYRAVPNPKNIVVIGGSFGGIELTRKLASSLTTGYRVVLVEKNSHFNYTFNFPRYSVLQGHEHLAFIPYDGTAKGAPAGIYRHVRGEASSITKESVQLASGEEIPYEYLVMATGATQRPPAKLLATDVKGACSELQGMQTLIQRSNTIAVIGGGAVGVELATDIKSYYPDKHVTLVHSHDRLLSRFKGNLHEEVVAALEKLGVEVLLKERPQLAPFKHNIDEELEQDKNQALTFSDGRVVAYDLVIPCTGQRPNSDLLAQIEPDAISNTTGRILVQPTLQIANGKGAEARTFALGDVAETDGPKMARAAWYQAEIVRQNILALIRGQKPSSTYVPNMEVEGSLKLTLGRADWIIYVKPEKGEAMITKGDNGKEDLEVHGAWAYWGSDIKQAIRPE